MIYTLRHAALGDSGAVINFFEVNRNPYNRAREDAELIRSIRDRKLFVVSDANGAIKAAAAVFGYRDGDYREVGAIFVDPDLRGIKLQQMLEWAMCLSEDILDGPAEDYTCFAIVAHDNGGSIHNLEAAGFVQAQPDDYIARNKNLAANRYYEVGPKALKDHARRLLEVAGEPDRRRRNGEPIHLAIDIAVLRPALRPVVEAYAQGRRGRHSSS